MILQKKIGNYNILALIKLYIYQHGIIVSNEYTEKFLKIQYSGYRTTSGLFIKLGGTYSKKEFKYHKKNKDFKHLEGDIQNLTYEDYLKNREWVTARIVEQSKIDFDFNSLTYFKLETNEQDKFIITGQYIDKDGVKHSIYLDDVGIFNKEVNNEEDGVISQAGGARARLSIAGANCASGCSFCSFGPNCYKYEKGTYTQDRLNNFLIPMLQDVISKEKLKHLFVTGGNPSLDDMENWTYYLSECIKSFKNELIKQNIALSNIKIDVMLTPRSFTKYVDTHEEYSKYLKYLKEMGVTNLAPNIEIWNEKYLKKYCPSNQQTKGMSKADIGHNKYIDYIKESVKIFGKFNVRSIIIVGLEPITETKKAIKQLIDLGCYVGLSPFVLPENLKDKTLLLHNSVSVDDLLDLNNYLEETFLKYLSNYSDEEKRELIENMNNSLNSHNRHNTANINGNITPLDYKEKENLLNGYDLDLATSINML